MSKLRRLATTLTLGALGALLLLPATGQGATNFGSRFANPPNQSCSEPGPCTVVSFIHPSDPDGDPYAGGAPVGGVITKFRIQAMVSGGPQQVTFRVANINRPDPSDEDNALASAAGTGPTVTLQPNEGAEDIPIQEFSGRLPVSAGQHLAIDANENVAASYDSSGDQFSYVFSPPLVDGSGARGSTEAIGELLVAATIEPDADADGFGDESQDGCPSQATTQGACDVTPPAVTGLKVRGSKVNYNLSEAATVTLRLERKSPGRRLGKKCVRQTKANRKKKRCPRFKQIGKEFSGPGAPGPNQVRLPGKKLKPGTYRLTLTVRDAAGNQATQTTTFVVKKKRKKGKGKTR